MQSYRVVWYYLTHYQKNYEYMKYEVLKTMNEWFQEILSSRNWLRLHPNLTKP